MSGATWSKLSVIIFNMHHKDTTNMPPKLALMYVRNIENKINTNGLKIFRSQELLPVSLETHVQYGGGDITRVRLNETRFGPKKSRPRYILTLF